MSEKVNVLYTFDTRFAKLAMVAMYSLLKHKGPSTRYVIHCMVAPRTRGRRKIARMVRRMGGELVWRVVRPRENPYQSYDYSRWSPVIFYRLIAHRVFPNLDKVLYMDSDTLACRDLSDLYNTDVSEYALGAVRDLAPTNDPNHPNGIYVKNFADKHLNGGKYFNSGVLLLNLRRMAENEQRLLDVKIDLKYPDQDILNAGLLGQVLFLPLRYNLAPAIMIPRTFSKADADDARANTAIWHFYSAKPYDYVNVPRVLYSLFYKLTTELGMHPDDFARAEAEHLRRRARRDTKTQIPYLRIRHGRLWLFGFLRI